MLLTFNFYSKNKTYIIGSFIAFFLVLYLFRLDSIILANEDEYWYLITGVNFFDYGHLVDNTGNNSWFSLQSVILGLINKTVGKNLFFYRIFSLLCAFGSSLCLYKSIDNLMRFTKYHNPILPPLGVALFLSNTLNFLIFRLARPEALNSFFIILAFCFFSRYLLNRNLKHLVMINVSMFLAFVTHFNSVITWFVFILLTLIFTTKEDRRKVMTSISLLIITLILLFQILIYLEKGLTIFEYLKNISIRLSISDSSNSNIVSFFSKWNSSFLRMPIWILDLISIVYFVFNFIRYKKFKLELILVIAGLLSLFLSLIAFNQFSVRHNNEFYVFMYFPTLIFLVHAELHISVKIRRYFFIGYLCYSISILFLFVFVKRNNVSFSKTQLELENFIQDSVALSTRENTNKIIFGNTINYDILTSKLNMKTNNFITQGFWHRNIKNKDELVDKVDLFIVSENDNKFVPHSNFKNTQIESILTRKKLSFEKHGMFISGLGKTYIYIKNH